MYSVSGTLIIGKGRLKDITNETKTINGVGNAYGDYSQIDMSPTFSPVVDSDHVDNVFEQVDKLKNTSLYPLPFWLGYPIKNNFLFKKSLD